MVMMDRLGAKITGNLRLCLPGKGRGQNGECDSMSCCGNQLTSFPISDSVASASARPPAISISVAPVSTRPLASSPLRRLFDPPIPSVNSFTPHVESTSSSEDFLPPRVDSLPTPEPLTPHGDSPAPHDPLMPRADSPPRDPLPAPLQRSPSVFRETPADSAAVPMTEVQKVTCAGKAKGQASGEGP